MTFSLQAENAFISQSYRTDSIVIISGHIVDSLTGIGIGNAMVTYNELPFGNYIGVVTSGDDGAYKFNTFGHPEYRIEISAENYRNIVDTILLIKAYEIGVLLKDYRLSALPSEDVIILENLIFDLGKSEIKPESFDELDKLVKLMKDNPEMVIQLEGHTDFRGGKSKNLKLSKDRVKEVKNYLIHGGIMPDRILTKAFGGTKPLSWEPSEEAARLNRRVEVRIIKL
jgi:outer membrane protein OmpA-like peptidoglycan-associated protein